MPQEFSASRDDIDSIAAWTVIRAARELARMLTVELAPLDLTPVEFGVLVQLAAADEPSQADLARAVGIRPQSMTAMVAGLADRGLLDRGQERGRGHLSRIRLTTGGRLLLSRAYPVVRASNRWFGEDEARTGSAVSILRPLLGDRSDGPDRRVGPDRGDGPEPAHGRDGRTGPGPRLQVGTGGPDDPSTGPGPR